MHSKKYISIFTALLFCFTGTLHAQYNPYWQWAKADTLNAKANENAPSVLAVKNSKVLWGRMTTVKRVSAGLPQGDYLISEYDSNGIQQSASAIVGKLQMIDAHADAAGNWYVLLKVYDTALFANGTRIARPNPDFNTDPDHFMVRYNAVSMNVQWIKAIGPLATASSRAFTLDANKIYIAVDSAGNTVVRSMSFATGVETSMFTQRGQSNTSSIQVDVSGNIYLAGSCASDGLNFNGATEPATIPDDYSYIVKYRSNGTHIWHHWMRDGFCFPRRLTLHNNRFLYYTGNLQDSFSIGGRAILQAAGTFDYIAARLDTSGAVVWVRQDSTNGQASFNEPFHAVVTPDTALVIFPQVTGYVNWRDSIESHLLGSSASTLVAIGPNNKARWARPIVARYTSNQHVVTEGTAIWVAGDAFTETGGIMLDTLRLKMPSRKFVSYLAKTKLIRPIPVPGGVGSFSADGIAVYPVPAHTVLRIEGLHGITAITLSDLSGRVVAQKMNTNAGAVNLNVEHIARGVYLLDMRNEAGRATRKVVLQ